ncbi:hypothetical protein, partial [Mycoplasmoides pneumoniae]|uniref:hypothetical protein n=1 Tax=Mycoplasmoides pneumoniae TaxID=2104 RepID=UPI001F44B464
FLTLQKFQKFYLLLANQLLNLFSEMIVMKYFKKITGSTKQLISSGNIVARCSFLNLVKKGGFDH